MRNLHEIDQYRRLDWEIKAFGAIGDSKSGCFIFEAGILSAKEVRCIASAGSGWDHVSVSLEDRCPTWDEMEAVRRVFAKDHETWMQLHLPAKEHVNCHPYCLHLWRPQHREIFKPPAIMVGPKTASTTR